MADDLAAVAAAVKERTEAVEEQKRLKQQARLAKLRAKKIKATQELQEKLVAPILLVLTIALSMAAMWYSSHR